MRPDLCEVGDNAWITDGVLSLNHDGSIAMLNRAGRTRWSISWDVLSCGKIRLSDALDPDAGCRNRAEQRGGCRQRGNERRAARRRGGRQPGEYICSVDDLLAKYDVEERTLWVDEEAQIGRTVIDFFMTTDHRGKYALRLRHGVTQLTR